MTLGELTDRNAVLDAIREYDDVGRERFLEKYGFGASRSYWVMHNGKRYDSKALVGAAHGYQYPEKGPLSNNEFSGGQETVQRVLEGLGFNVEVDDVAVGLPSWIRNLRVARLQNGSPAPHKPLLILLGLRAVEDGKDRLQPVADVAGTLDAILHHLLPEVNSPSPWEPIWRLEEDCWEIVDASGTAVARDPGREPPLPFLRQPGLQCGFIQRVFDELADSDELVSRIRQELLSRYLEGLPETAMAELLDEGASSRVWWVNQGQTYQQELAGEYVWAPTETRAGRSVAHHSAVARLRAGDVVVHYSRGAIRALGSVLGSPSLAPRPTELPERPWSSEGYRAPVRYFELTRSISLDELDGRPVGKGPFSRGGAVNQGYLYPLPLDWANTLKAEFADRWPPGSPWNAVSSRHWLFQANPKKWDLSKRLETWLPGEVEPWTVTQYRNEIREGDDVLLFASGVNGGILGLGVVASEVASRRRPEWLVDGPDMIPQVDVRLIQKLDPPISRTEISEHSILSQMVVMRFANATNFRITDQEWDAVRAVRSPLGLSPSQRCLAVYISRSSSLNFAHSSGDGRWGWRNHQIEYDQLKAGDFIIFGVGFTGGSPRVQLEDFVTHRFERLVVGRITSPVEEYVEAYWPDETVNGTVVYPYRVVFEVIEELGDTAIGDLDQRFGGPVEDALRRSALGGGRGILVTANVDRYENSVTLDEIVSRFALDLKQAGFDFGGTDHDEFVRAFVVSLATKGFVILTGMSGSGKTKIAQLFGQWLGTDLLEIVSVRPDWTNPDALLGYENGLSELKANGYAWNVPGALRFMLRAIETPDQPHLLLLDEMNLAHVERYFADILSGMESGHDVIPNLSPQGGEWRLRDINREKLPFPRNVFIVGTVNVDETTYMFSPKVLDRANTLELRVHSAGLKADNVSSGPVRVSPNGFAGSFQRIASTPASQSESHGAVSQVLVALHELLSALGREFGHRTYKEALRFCDLWSMAGGENYMTALDLQVLQKVLPKIHGSIREVLTPLKELGQWSYFGPNATGNPEFDIASEENTLPELPKSFDKIQRMAKRLAANHFVSFAE